MLDSLDWLLRLTRRLTGGGLWQPAAQPLGLLRRSIDRRPERLKQVLAEPEFAEEFFGAGVSGDERKAVMEFTEINKEGALKTAPKVSSFLFCQSCDSFLASFAHSLFLSSLPGIPAGVSPYFHTHSRRR